MIIWQYWTGPKPAHIRLCEESLERHLGAWTLVRLNDETARKRFPGMHRRWEDIPIAAHKADYFRAYALAHEGGLWIDSDILIVVPLDECRDWIAKYGLCVCGTPGKPFEGFIGGKAKHPFLVNWCKRADAVLGKGLRFPWGTIGAKIVRPLAGYIPKRCYIREARVVPLRGHQRKLLNKKRQAWHLLKPDSIGVHLFNKAWGKHWAGMNRDDLLEGPTLRADLFRYALGMR